MARLLLVDAPAADVRPASAHGRHALAAAGPHRAGWPFAPPPPARRAPGPRVRAPGRGWRGPGRVAPTAVPAVAASPPPPAAVTTPRGPPAWPCPWPAD